MTGLKFTVKNCLLMKMQFKFLILKITNYYGNHKTNVVITSQARLKLYSELELLNDRVLYCDTDSIIYVSRPNKYDPKLGDYLGEFTNEIDPKDGNYIQEFVSTGLKSYAYKTDTGHTKCTCKVQQKLRSNN